MRAIEHLVALLVDPAHAAAVPDAAWSGILSVARAEMMIGTLGHRLAGQPLPPVVADNLAAAARAADQAQVQALWEAEMCRRAIAPLGIEPILLKGTAYAAAGLPNAAGRNIGDCDILVPRDRLDEVEAALLAAGWEWVKDDPYDQAYYRNHMHELPPLIHRDRDRMIDVHHTILPLTAGPRPDAPAMVAGAVRTANGWLLLSPIDRAIHCAVHLIADGDLAGGLRNLWDFHSLRSAVNDDWNDVIDRAEAWHFGDVLPRAARLTIALFGSAKEREIFRFTLTDRLFVARILARDDWGRETRPWLRLGFYIRSHLLRMPLPMLLRHLWVKWRRG